MTESLSPLVFGFAFTTVAGLLTGLVTRGIWRRWGSLINAVSDPWNAALIGLVERPLYLAALVGHLPAFIGIWLGLKFGGWWKASSENVAPLSSAFFSGFLAANGLSVLYAASGYAIIQLLIVERHSAAIAVGAAVIVLNITLWLLTLPDAPKQLPRQTAELPKHLVDEIVAKIPRTVPPTVD